MDERLTNALALQQIVSKQTKLLARKKEIPELIARIEHDKTEREGELARAEKDLHDAQAAQRAAESAVKDGEALSAKLLVQINQVKNNKEYQAMQHEIEATKNTVAEAEATVVSSLEAIEHCKQKVAQLRKEVQEDLSDLNEQIMRLKKELDGLPVQLKALQAQQREARALVPKELLAKLEKLFQVRAGLAMVSCHEGTCDGCRQRVTPEVLNLAKRGLDILFCEHCSRLLYWAE